MRSFTRERGRNKQVHDMNITPMVDVMFSLLVVFMITAPLVTTGIPLDLPRGDGKAIAGENKTVNISIDKNGDTYIGTDKIAQAILVDKVKAITNENPNADVIISADNVTAYGAVMEVMGKLRIAGYTKVGLRTDSRNLLSGALTKNRKQSK